MLSERELESRYEVLVEQYVTKINIEAETAASIARTMLLPAAVRWSATLDAAGTAQLKDELTPLIDEFFEAIFALEARQREPPRGRRTCSTARSTSRPR